MRYPITRATAPLLASWCALAFAFACSDGATEPSPGAAGSSPGASGRGGSGLGGTGGMKGAPGGSGSGFAGSSANSGGNPGAAGSGSPASGGSTATTGGASTTGGGGPVAGSGGSTSAGASGSSVGGSSGTGTSGPVSCHGIVDAGFELCSSGADFCAAVFTDGEGCHEVCAAAGLACAEAWENEEDSCAPDTERAQLSCDSDHESDYCLCRGAGNQGAGGNNSAGGSGGMAGSNAEGGADSGGSGGSANSGGSAGSGGKSSGGTGGKGSGGSGNQPAIGPGPCGCESPAGEFGTVDDTIIVRSGEVYDGQCRIYRANPDTLGAGDQEEGQLPVFRVEDGGELRNVVLGASAADGVHTYGDVRLENIHWLDIGEDAMTVKESGTVYLNCGSSAQGSDKTFQVNAASTIYITNFTASDAGKFMRQNGGTDFEVNVTIDHCDISSMDEVIFRTDSSSSHVTLTNTRYSNLGDGLFMFGDDVVNGNSAQSTVSNNQEY